MANKRNGDSVVHQAMPEMTSEEKKYAAEYLNETDEIREDSVPKIRRWIEDELWIRSDDFLTLRFLRVCKFDIEKTKTRIRNYYQHRSNMREWYSNIDPFRPELQEIFALGMYLPLRKLDNKGRAVIFFRGTVHDPSIHKISDIVKASVSAIEMAVKYYPAASVYGYVLFFDMINPTMDHIIQTCNPYVVKNVAHSWGNCYPMRIQSINIINASTILNAAITLFKSILPQKISSRVNVYPHMSPSCFTDIPDDILPVEYSGTGGTIQELTEFWQKILEENRNWFPNDESDKLGERFRQLDFE